MTARKATYSVTVDGKTHSRRSARVYTHAVVRSQDARVSVTFAGSLELAEKAVRSEQGQDRKWNRGNPASYQVLPVEVG